MKMNPLGRTGLTVSELCLGTMTWGNRNTEAEGHAQIDMALEAGINFVDTAEMYPVAPVLAETCGATEAIIGTWNAANKARRGDYILATKVSGAGLRAVRDGAPITPDTIRTAIDGSLARLQTDYIDLYQLHWPNRGSYHFRRNWVYAPGAEPREKVLDHMVAVLETLQALVDEGKIRHIGLSNETAWGTGQWLRLSEDRGLPRVQTMQNEYSLLCRLYDTDMAEQAMYEDVGLIAYSPLATGMLSGKYQGGVVPENTRLDRTGDLGGRKTDRAFAAVDAYLDIANRHGLDPVQMSLAWCRTRPFMTSAIFGATSTEQLATILGSVEVELSKEVLAEIDAAHRAHPMPF